MEKKQSFNYLYLINSLVLFGADFEYLKSLDGPNFDIEFELGSDFEIGFDQDLLNNLLSEGIIGEGVFKELLDFKEYILLIPDTFWTIEELESNSIWDTVRGKAKELLTLIGEPGKEYNFSIIRNV
jgi:hypothetical protein